MRLTLSSNAEEMLTEEGTPKTSHTTNKVPFVMANAPNSWSLKKTDGVLGDVAPTILATMGLEPWTAIACLSSRERWLVEVYSAFAPVLE
jgi:bisphosphoglycerate-independent phosphoglycerate mutase (AlkP superfamily)